MGKNKTAFTLVELLVVIGIIGILASLLLPALVYAKKQGQRAACISNLRQIGIATLLYAQDTGYYPPAWVNSTIRWMDLIKPYIEKNSKVFLCPSDDKKASVMWDTNIFLSYGINTFRFGDQESCFWYGVKYPRVKRPVEIIIFADCTPGKYYCGGGGVFKEPVIDVDYRHPKKSFSALFCDGHTETKVKTMKSNWDASQ